MPPFARLKTYAQLRGSELASFQVRDVRAPDYFLFVDLVDKQATQVELASSNKNAISNGKTIGLDVIKVPAVGQAHLWLLSARPSGRA